MDELLTPRELAALLKVSIRQVQAMAANREIPAFRLSGSQRGEWRFRRSEIDAWLEARRNQPREGE